MAVHSLPQDLCGEKGIGNTDAFFCFSKKIMNEIVSEIHRTLCQGSLKNQTEYCLATATADGVVTTWTRPIEDSRYYYETSRLAEDRSMLYLFDRTDLSVWSYETHGAKISRFRCGRTADLIVEISPTHVTRLLRQPRPATAGQCRYLGSLVGIPAVELLGLAEVAAKRLLGGILDEPRFGSFSRDILEWRRSAIHMMNQPASVRN